MSINDGAYVSLDQPSSSPTSNPVSKSQGFSFGMTMAIACIVGIMCAIIAAGVALGTQSDSYSPSTPYVMPQKAIVSMTFHSPYFGETFAQPITAYVDHESGQARWEYYNGANVFIYNKAENTTNYNISPVYDRQICFKNPHDKVSQLPTLFPKLQYHQGESGDDDSDEHGPKLTAGNDAPLIRLYQRGGQAKVNDILCDVWTYAYIRFSNATTDSYSSLEPDQFGHAGNYTFYVNAETGTPVRFHMFGHNVFNSGSHVETYYVDYHSISAVKSLPSILFAPPSGMPCVSEHVEVTKRHRSPVDLMVGSFSHTAQNKRVVLEDALFEQWSNEHQKLYTNADELSARKTQFFKTFDMITAHNANPTKSYTMGLNKYADMTSEELALLSGGRRSQRSSGAQNKLTKPHDACTEYVPIVDPERPLPKAHDWRKDERLVQYLDPTVNTRMSSQLSCGSCWAQGLARATATSHYLSTDAKYNPNNKIDASVQQILDCTNGEQYDVYGCNGGIDFQGASWLLDQNEGLVAEDTSYGHFRNANGFCQYSVKDTAISGVNPWTGEKIVPFTQITACEHVGDQWNKEEEVKDLPALVKTAMNALYFHGPLSVSIDVPQSLYYYKAGIYDDVACGHLNADLTHTVTLVAYDQEGDYFVIDNSWSTMYVFTFFAFFFSVFLLFCSC